MRKLQNTGCSFVLFWLFICKLSDVIDRESWWIAQSKNSFELKLSLGTCSQFRICSWGDYIDPRRLTDKGESQQSNITQEASL